MRCIINLYPYSRVDEKFDIVLNTKVYYQTTFDKVTAEHALKEGEGDLSLSY